MGGDVIMAQAQAQSQSKVACLLGQGFEDSELRVPYDRLRTAGLAVEIIGTRAGESLTGYRGRETVNTDRGIDDARPDEYAALLIPGGHSPDQLRGDPRFVEFVKAFDATGRPLAAVCHGPQLLIAAGLVRGRTMTAWKTIQEDLRQIGAKVVDEAVVTDRNWITSRQPEDLELFSEALIRAVGSGESRTRFEAPFARKGEQSVSDASEEELPSQRPRRGIDEQPGVKAAGRADDGDDT
jgi:protease I